MIQIDQMRWKNPAIVGIVLGLCVGPMLWTIANALVRQDAAAWQDVFYRPFYETSWRSLKLFAATVGMVMLLGSGVMFFYLRAHHVSRTLCSAVMLIPLLIPPFFWAIGFQNLAPFLAFRHRPWLDGFWGSVWACSTFALPIAVIAGAIALRGISRAASDSAIQLGGEKLLMRLEWNCCFPALTGGAILGGVLALADTGVGNITGYHTLSGDILVEFSARADFSTATAKTLATLVILGPVLFLGFQLVSRAINFSESGRTFLCRNPSSSSKGSIVPSLVLVPACGVLLIPAIYGLWRPLLRPPTDMAFHSATKLANESFSPTGSYALGAGLTSVLLGYVLVTSLGRDSRLLRVIVLVALLFLAPPSALHGLGVVSLRTIGFFRELTDSAFASGAAHGLRLIPLAGVLLAISLWRIPVSTIDSAQIHGVGRLRMFAGLLWPASAWAAVAAMIVIGAISLSDVSTGMLLQVPGESTFGNHLFARMDNSSEKLVSAMCFLYAVPALVIASLFIAGRWIIQRENKT